MCGFPRPGHIYCNARIINLQFLETLLIKFYEAHRCVVHASIKLKSRDTFTGIKI